MNIPIFVETFSILTDFAVLEDIDAYRDEGMGNVIFGEPFLREVGINAKWFEGMITMHNGNEEVTYQMVRSHPRFKHHTNEQCNKIPPLLKKKLKAMVFKVDFEKAFDSIRWDYLDDVLKSFGFGVKWRAWISGCLKLVKGYVLVYGIPTLEFQFHRGLKQGDPLSPFLFILIMESLHLSFKKVMNAGLFTGNPLDNSLTISHLFYADDAIFVGKWDSSNLKIILKVLKCFHMASRLKININKSKLMGYDMHSDEVEIIARYIGCATFVAPFSHLGVKVGGRMERINSWDDVVSKVTSRLSKWKLKMLCIGGRLTFIKLVWHFLSQTSSPWTRTIKVIHGEKGNLRAHGNITIRSPWLDIVREINVLRVIGIDFLSLIRKKVGNDEDILWEDSWFDEISLKQQFSHLYSLESAKHINVAEKMNHHSLSWSYRREPIGGIEEEQQNMLFSRINGVILPNTRDRWIWSFEASGDFSVTSARRLIDDYLLPEGDVQNRWVKVVPIKINIFAWIVHLDKLPTRLNLSLRGVEISSIMYPLCNSSVESASRRSDCRSAGDAQLIFPSATVRPSPQLPAFSGAYTSAQAQEVFDTDMEHDNISDRDGASMVF
nr:RNA-directed DNA polymerase, eukaryota, reverse transcriptase zinc-binding domain protein [Tanacetum cinerariifolium]